MKKIILICLALLAVFPAKAEIVFMDKKNNPKNELFIDERGLYRYLRGRDVYEKECKGVFPEEVRKKCIASERATWEKGKTAAELKKEGTLFTGKIRMPSINGKDIYFFVKEGEITSRVNLFSGRYYFDPDSDNKNVLYDITTEEPYSGSVVIGGVKGLTPEKEKAKRYIIQQDYEKGFPVGEPVLITVK